MWRRLKMTDIRIYTADLRIICFAVFLTLVSAGQSRPPRITEQPSDVLVRKFEPATLNCKAEGRPEPTITWYHDGIEVRVGENPNRIMVHGGSLFFLEVMHSKRDQDTGTYWCIATNEIGLARSRNATLEVATLREDFRVLPKNVMAAMGETATLECMPPKGYPEPVVRWKKDGEPVSLAKGRIHIVAPGNLVLTDVQQSDEGRYICTAENLAAMRETLSVHLAVHVKPFFLKEPEHVTVLSNVNVEFECRVGGDPLPTITWHRQDDKMPPGRANIAENKSLIIRDVTPADDGTYVCEARNPVGSISSSVSLTVHSRPQFLVTPRDQKVSLNGVAKFECSASGHPPPSIFWTKEGNQLLMFPERVYGHFSVNRQGSLLISGVKREDQGFYTCSVISGIGSTMAKAYLEVSSVKDHTAPIIRLGAANQTLPVNTVALLPCEADGYPTPSIKWYINSIPLNLDNPKYTLLDSGTLQIDDLQPTDTGIYKCTATSESGETSWSASLSAESPRNPNAIFHRMPDASAFPDAPSQPIAVNITQTSVTLSWKKNHRVGLSSLIGYTVEYYSNELQNGWMVVANRIAKEVFVVQNLRPDTHYVFLVRAENSYGLGYPSPISDMIKTMGLSGSVLHYSLTEARSRLNSVVVFLQDVIPTSSTSVKMLWKIQGEVNYVEGFYIRFRDASGGSQKYNMVTVFNGVSSSYILTDLLKYTKYEFFLVPFYKNIEGSPSNSKTAQTLEDVPSAPPFNVHVDVIGQTAALILWSPPPPQHQNGILQGYHVKVEDEDLALHSFITTNASTGSVKLVNFTAGASYYIKAAAFTSTGIGPYSPAIRPKIDFTAVTLGKNPQSHINDLIGQPWFIALIASLIFIVLSILFVILFFRRKMAWKKSLQAHLSAPVLKADDMRVGVSAQETLWINHAWHPTPSIKSSQTDNKLIVNMNPNENYLSGGTSDYAEVDTHSMTTFYKKEQSSILAPYATTTLINPSPIYHNGSSIHEGKSSSSEASKRSDKMCDMETRLIEDSTTERLVDARNMVSPSSDSGSYTTDEYGLPIRRKRLKPGCKNNVVNWADLIPPPPEHPPSAGPSPTATPSTIRNPFPRNVHPQIQPDPSLIGISPIVNRNLHSNPRQGSIASPWNSLNRPTPTDTNKRAPTPPSAPGSRFPSVTKQKPLSQMFGSSPLIDRGVQSSLVSLNSDPYGWQKSRQANSEKYSNVNAAGVPYYQLQPEIQSQGSGRYGFIVPSRVQEATSAESSAAEDTDYAQGHAPASSWTSATDRSNTSSVRSSIASSSDGSVYTDSDFVNAVTRAAHNAGVHLLPSHPSNIDSMSPSMSLLSPVHN